ncbi:hypothetical protein GJAV_G00229850 [Gymnothorax javanicus]|nr:hypothetical protein GJAV_G00229850 [Gymnothorax javanicus]
MKPALKHWKEAATVILAARTTSGLAVDSLKRSANHLPPNSTKSVHADKPGFDYKVLCLKRSSKSRFMPNAYVFPGGVVEPADFSSDWLETFTSFRHLPNFGLGFVKQAPESRPPIFAMDRLEPGSLVSSSVALRICAVRETFEESGILLAVPKNSLNNITDIVSHGKDKYIDTSLTGLNDTWDKLELSRWRSLVIENASNFIRMCRELDCVPNIWGLHEWGNWLTPIGSKSKQRYDTAFFICCLNDIPNTTQDEKEIVHFKWSTPTGLLQSYQAEKLYLATPQIYELGRLCHFPQLQELLSFASKRAEEGCEQFVAVRLMASDCLIFLLPGDDLYPKNVFEIEERGAILSRDEGFEQLQQESSALHRMVFFSPHSAALYVNITPKYNHLLPTGAPSLAGSPLHKSQL